MGSQQEFAEMVLFVAEHEIRPIVHRVVHGIEDLTAINWLYKDMIEGRQFGKLVAHIVADEKEARL